jgi:hypothetical protein
MPQNDEYSRSTPRIVMIQVFREYRYAATAHPATAPPHPTGADPHTAPLSTVMGQVDLVSSLPLHQQLLQQSGADAFHLRRLLCDR